MATLVRWEPFRELATMQTEMSRLMNGLLEGNGRDAGNWVPALDVWETDSEIVYAFDLPGVSEDKISVELQDDTLTVSAERERTEEQNGEDGFVRYERRFGSFSRTVGVPQGVTEDGDQGDVPQRRARDPRREARGAEAAPDPDRRRAAGADRGLLEAAQ